MKISKIISLVLIGLLIGSVAFAATPGRDLGHGAGDVMGNNSSRYDWSPQKTFRLVRYVPQDGYADCDSNSLSANALVVWDAISDDGVTVTTTITSHDSTVAGIIVQTALTPVSLGNTAQQDYSLRNWTWLQTYGLSGVSIGDTVAAGDAMGGSTIQGKADPFVASTTAAGANGNAGFFYDTAIGGVATAVECFVRCE